ncbi:MAG: indole-3-glycerol phosphate synthase TrpC [Myxococcota bacterium]
MSFLERILERKREELARLAGEAARIERAAARAPTPRGFHGALRTAERPRVIAEFKRASPSRGRIRDDADPAALARAYEAAGAAALSVLTDSSFFEGTLRDLSAARAACTLPVLRKDFLIDPLQLLEARAAGADAVLLIVAALDDAALKQLLEAAAALGLDALVEVHEEAELARALGAGAELLGINNRNLHSFRTDVETTRALIPLARGCTVVSESGLDDPALLRNLEACGVQAFLVGEALMAAPDPAAALRTLRGRA